MWSGRTIIASFTRSGLQIGYIFFHKDTTNTNTITGQQPISYPTEHETRTPYFRCVHQAWAHSMTISIDGERSIRWRLLFCFTVITQPVRFECSHFPKRNFAARKDHSLYSISKTIRRRYDAPRCVQYNEADSASLLARTGDWKLIRVCFFDGDANWWLVWIERSMIWAAQRN